jgi:polyisoprenoid-binding protein YceI
LQSETVTTHNAADKAVSRYTLVTGRSVFTVQAFSTGVLSVFGHNPKIAVREFQGEIQFVAAANGPESVCVQLKIGARSLEVIDDISEKDRREIHRQMYDEVLEVDRFPDILFESSRVTAGVSGGDRLSATVEGRLTLHGETRSVAIPASVVISGDILRASGEFNVSQSSFGIAPVTVAGGAIKLKDEVKCAFNVVARKEG